MTDPAFAPSALDANRVGRLGPDQLRGLPSSDVLTLVLNGQGLNLRRSPG